MEGQKNSLFHVSNEGLYKAAEYNLRRAKKRQNLTVMSGDGEEQRRFAETTGNEVNGFLKNTIAFQLELSTRQLDKNFSSGCIIPIAILGLVGTVGTLILLNS